MRLTTSTSTARIGNVEIRGVQHVLELEALDTSFEAISNTPRGSHHHTYSPTKSQSVSPEDLYAVQSRTAIVVPCKDESLERIHGVWAAIPSSSLIILVSASEVEAYVQERTKLANFCRLTGRNAIAIHQCDPTIAAALRAVGLPELLDDKGDGLVHRGKGEALAIGIALAATARGPPDTKSIGQRTGEDTVCGYYKYIGFVDADNFIPGSVHEYCRAFSAGLHLAQAEDSMVRISWASKPKVHNGKIEFKQLGRSSEIVNQWLNKLLEKMDANIETDADASRETEAPGLICTGNAGEHAMTLSLALKLRVASGYAIEPFHFLDILERFVGGQDASVIGNMDKRGKTAASSPSTLPTPATDAEQPLGLLKSLSLLPSPAQSPMDGSPPKPTIQILQIRTINPHFHDNKGEAHIARMWKQGLSAIYHSPLTHVD
ncbi:family 55 glycosyltransferase, partial [Cryphonectria parasitica EP155]